MFAKGQAVIQLVELLAPKHLALPNDKIGLQLGTLQKEIKKVMVTLDVTLQVVEEAIRKHVDLLIAHHAIIYRPLDRIITDSPEGRVYELLIKHDIAVYVAHTNLDVAHGGINDMMADALALNDVTFLKEAYIDAQGNSFGIGRVGKLSNPINLSELAESVKRAFDVPTVRVVGDLQRSIRKVAVLGGSGGRYLKQALFVGADVLITGDIDYHSAHDALAAGVAVIDPGHNSEKIMKRPIAEYLTHQLQAKKYDTAVLISDINTEPFTFH